MIAFLFKVKQALFWIAYRLDGFLPMRLRTAMRNRCLPWGRPVLDVAEIHIIDHCNLNCTGCLHFTPLAQKWFASADAIASDLAALRMRFRKIRHVTLLGGEPLLHPEYEKIVAAVRNASPESLVTIVTNGVALKGDFLEKFLSVCKKCGVRVKWTVYPPLRNRRREIKTAFKAAGVRLFTVDANEFYVKMNPAGCDARKAMAFCRKTTYCPYLRDGRIYTCAQAYHISDYIAACSRERFPAPAMRKAKGLDVRDASITGWRILAYLMSPCETCVSCSDHFRLIPWSQGCKSVKDWIA